MRGERMNHADVSDLGSGSGSAEEEAGTKV